MWGRGKKKEMRREDRGEERRGTGAGYKGWGRKKAQGKRKRRKNRSRKERRKKRDFSESQPQGSGYR